VGINRAPARAMSIHVHPTKFLRGGVCCSALAGLVIAGCTTPQTNGPVPAPSASAPLTALVQTPSFVDAARTGDATSAIEDDSLAAEELQEHHRCKFGGLSRFTSLSLDTLGIGDERGAKIDTIQAGLDAALEPLGRAEQSLIATLVTGVAAGTVNTHDVDLAIARITKAAESSRSATASAMNDLHRALTPVERGTVGDKMRAHWTVWQEVNEDQGNVAPEDDPRGIGRIARLTRLLALTPSQVDRIAADLRAASAASRAADTRVVIEVDARLRAFADAFSRDAFDAAAALASNSTDTQLATLGATRMARFFTVATSALSIEQRTALVAYLRDRLDGTDAGVTR